MPKRATYPFADGGNILVNCRGGRSRSVSLVALFLHKQQPHLFPTLDAAVAHIREHRELIRLTRNQDADKAAELIARHVEGSGRHLLEQMRALDATPAS